jgi:hypothetical protein
MPVVRHVSIDERRRRRVLNGIFITIAPALIGRFDDAAIVDALVVANRGDQLDG